MAEQRLNLTAILLLVVLLLIIATGVVLYFQLRTDEVSGRLSTGEVLRTLVVAHDEDRPFLSFVFFYHPGTRRAAMMDIPGNFGTVLRSLGRVDRIDSVFSADDPEQYRAEVERAIGTSIPTTLVLSESQLVDLIDLLGGLELFIIHDYGTVEGPDPILLPTGNVRLNGEKAVQYLRLDDDIETELERIGRRQSFVQALVRGIRNNRRFLEHPDVIEIRERMVETELDRRSLTTLFTAWGDVDAERIVRRRVQGTLRTIDVGGERRELLFPHFEGQWLKQTVQQIEQTLGSSEEDLAENVVVAMEILNGTATSGLARRTSELYEDYGFEVRRFGNADSNQVEHTLVIDRRGTGNLATQVAQVIRAQRVVTEIQPGGDVDVTLIIGKDFDGSVVRTQ
ncbi:MAG: LCP family protein [Alkalispirochaeta sp.]